MFVEWNVYWDLFVIERVWKIKIFIVFCLLDIINNVFLIFEFFYKLGR